MRAIDILYIFFTTNVAFQLHFTNISVSNDLCIEITPTCQITISLLISKSNYYPLNSINYSSVILNVYLINLRQIKNKNKKKIRKTILPLKHKHQ